MKFGTGFPLTANFDRAATRDFAQALDGAGFDYVGLGGHVLSAEADRFPDRPNFDGLKYRQWPWALPGATVAVFAVTG